MIFQYMYYFFVAFFVYLHFNSDIYSILLFFYQKSTDFKIFIISISIIIIHHNYWALIIYFILIYSIILFIINFYLRIMFSFIIIINFYFIRIIIK